MLTLRDVEVEDREQLREWRNLPEVAQYMYSEQEISAEQHRAWFDRMMGDDSSRYWIIAVDGHDVGVANIYNINHENRRAEWAFYVADPRARGKGIGTFVEYSVLRYVFGELGLHKLMCEVLAFNEGVIKMHKRYGFQQEGVLRDHALKDEGFVNAVHLSMLEDEWPEAKEILEKRLKEKGLWETIQNQ